MRDASLTREIAGSLDDRRLHLIVLPTEQCNFRCVYCYEDFAVGAMDEAVQGALIRLVERRAPTLDLLEVEWFGGEPLLAMEVIDRLSRAFLGLASGHPGLRYHASATTNGDRLSVEAAARLLELGVRAYQVSLDGPPEFHDRTRVRAGGQPTFARIWRNLEALAASDLPIEVLLRVHLTPENVAVMEDFVGWLEAGILRDRRFGLLLKPVEHMGGPRDATFRVLGDRPLPGRLGRVHEIHRPGAEGEAMGTGSAVCYAAKANSFVVRADGRLAKCTIAFDDPRNQIGRLTPDGSLALDHERLRPWFAGLLSADADTLACPLAAIPRADRARPAGVRSLPIVDDA